MTHTPHELAEDFADYRDQLATLRQTDAHFHKLTEDYHALNRAIHRAETDVEPTDDLHMSEMRKSRMVLKDKIYARLRAAG